MSSIKQFFIKHKISTTSNTEVNKTITDMVLIIIYGITANSALSRNKKIKNETK